MLPRSPGVWGWDAPPPSPMALAVPFLLEWSVVCLTRACSVLELLPPTKPQKRMTS